MDKFYINENTEIKAIRDTHRKLAENKELTTRSLLEEHRLVMNILCGDPKPLNTMEDNRDSMKTLVIEGRKDFRARTPDQIEEFEDEERGFSK